MALRSRFSEPHFFLRADLASEESVKTFVQEAMSRLGAPDLVLNNGAVVNDNAPLWEISDQAFGKLMDINVRGVASVIRHTVPAMIQRGTGIIVNFSSGWGRSTSPEVAPYCASKWAIEGLSAALAQELPVGLAAAALNPGIIDTEMLRRCFGESASSYPRPEAWAKVAVPYLASLTPRCNGQQLTAPG